MNARLLINSNSFEHTTPFSTEIVCQEKAIEMDPPLVIPKELRPLGAKRRYLRTVQLIADPIPIAASTRNPLQDDRSQVPFEDLLRKKDPARLKLQRANSHTVLPVAKAKKTRLATGNHKSKQVSSMSEFSDSIGEGRDEDGGGGFLEEENEDVDDEDEGRAMPRQRAKSGKLQSKPPLLVRFLAWTVDVLACT